MDPSCARTRDVNASTAAGDDALLVLVADDEPGTRLLLAAVVEGLGHECIVAADGDDAWRLYRSERPDVVITDWQMPGLDGALLSSHIRAELDTAYTYIIVLTGQAGERDARATVAAGADDVLFKPLDPGAIERRLISASRLTRIDRERRRAQNLFAVQHAVTCVLAEETDLQRVIARTIEIVEAGLHWSSGTHRQPQEHSPRAGNHVAFEITTAGGVDSILEFRLGELADRPDPSLLAAIGTGIGQFIDRGRAAREAERLKDDFFGLVSHELRTPLTSVIGYVELLIEEDPDAERQALLAIVDRNAQRLLRLVGDLLFAAQVEHGGIELDCGPIDLAELLAEAVAAARLSADAAGISIHADLDRLPPHNGDHDRLAQIADNLLSNAIKYTPAGGRIDVRLRHAGERATVEVQDTGFGIPADQQPQLFERFYRGRLAVDRAIQGAGLGLAIVKAIAEAHGGTVALQSTEGLGTTVRLELPLS